MLQSPGNGAGAAPRPIEAFFPKQWFKVKGGKNIKDREF